MDSSAKAMDPEDVGGPPGYEPKGFDLNRINRDFKGAKQ